MTHIAANHSGWLTVLFEPSKVRVSLPNYLNVEIKKTKDKRDYFTILEGVHKGKEASVKVNNLGTSTVYLPPARLTFNLAKEELRYGTGKVASAITDEYNPIPKGSNKIQLPDFPHDLGSGYLGISTYSLSWFYLGLGNAISGQNGKDRYLHTGSISAGCVTVSPSDWDDLYKYLIRSREGDKTNVGIIKIV